MGTDTAKLETIRTTMEERGVEFMFAKFVDMNGRPSAKRIRKRNSTIPRRMAWLSCFRGRRRSAQPPSDPAHCRHAQLQLHARTVGSLVTWHGWRLRRHGGGEARPYSPMDDLRNVTGKGRRQGYELDNGHDPKQLPRASSTPTA